MEVRSSSSLPKIKLPESQTAKGSEPSAQSDDATRLSGLESAVVNNKSASKSIEEVGEKGGVEQANRESANSSVRDVEAASALVSKLADKISRNSEEALAAQANQNPGSVRNLLS